jgi:DNA modification methylase
MKASILVGHVLERLKDIPDGSVQTCVTSPPYWGLRDYGEESQIGLEKTPQEYVEKIVAVFREVKRVLRDDGTVFLNLGDSYSGYHGNSRVPDDKAPSNKPGYWENMRPSSVGVRRGVVCGTSDRVPANSLSHGCLCGSLCDACRVAYRIGKSRNDSLPFPMPTLSPSLPTREHKESERDHPPTSDSSLRVAHTEASTLDSVRAVDHVLVQPPSSLPSMHPQSSLQFQALRSEVSTQDVKCLLCGCSLIDCAQESVHKSDGMGDEGDCMGGNASPSVEQENRSRYTCDYCLQIAPYQDYTIQSLPPKNLVGIPWRVAFALQDDGWILRQDIIWHKPGPMPESMTDRCTKAHEYVFLLSKKPQYFFDNIAISEDAVNAGKTVSLGEKSFSKGQANGLGIKPSGNGTKDTYEVVAKRNKRTVWTISSGGYDEAHFAVYPEALVEPCILAGTSEHGACPECGSPYKRIMQKTGWPDPENIEDDQGRMKASGEIATDTQRRKELSGAKHAAFKAANPDVLLGWEPTCKCVSDKPLKPCLVLDPFCGSGTTGVVSLRYHRDFVGVELNPEYASMAERRIGNEAPMFNEVEVK